MKECKIITINDGSGTTKINGGYHLVEEYPWSDEVLNWYLNEGFEIKHVVQLFNPGEQGQSGAYNFYVGGWTIFLERETEEPVACHNPDDDAFVLDADAEEDADFADEEEYDEDDIDKADWFYDAEEDADT